MDILPQIYVGEDESAWPVGQFPGHQFADAYCASLSSFLHSSRSLVPPALHGNGFPSPSLIEDMVFPQDIAAVGSRLGSVYSTTEAGLAITSCRPEMLRPAATSQPLTGYAVSQRNVLSARTDRNGGPDLGSQVPYVQQVQTTGMEHLSTARRPRDTSWLAAGASPPHPVLFEWGASTLPVDDSFLLPWAAASPPATVSGVPFEFAPSAITPSLGPLESQGLNFDDPNGLGKPDTAVAGRAEPIRGDARSQADARKDHKPFSCPWDGCGSWFNTIHDLRAHLRECGKRISLSIRKAQKKFFCRYTRPETGKPCNTAFTRQYDLTRHQDCKHNRSGARMHCSHCQTTFNRSDALKRHLRAQKCTKSRHIGNAPGSLESK